MPDTKLRHELHFCQMEILEERQLMSADVSGHMVPSIQHLGHGAALAAPITATARTGKTTQHGHQGHCGHHGARFGHYPYPVDLIQPSGPIEPITRDDDQTDDTTTPTPAANDTPDHSSDIPGGTDYGPVDDSEW